MRYLTFIKSNDNFRIICDQYSSLVSKLNGNKTAIIILVFLLSFSVTTFAAVPAAPVAIAATSIAKTSFKANWGAVSGATGYRLDVSTSSSFSSFVSGFNNLSLTATTKSVTGLTANTTYYYRVRAANASGTSANSNTITVTTLLVAPTSSAATNKTATSFSANWGAVTGATGYRLDVSANSSFSSFVTGYDNLAVITTTSSVTGLTANTSYYYRVRATNATSTSANSSTRTAITLVSAPVPTAATVIATISFTANWGSVTGATGYYLDVSLNGAFSSFVTGFNNLSVTTTAKSVTGITANTTYYYRVRAKNANGTSANSNTITTATLPVAPGAPTATAATSITSTSFSANWGSASGATGYKLDVSLNSGFSSFVTGYNNLAVATTTISVTDLTAGTTYYYRVRATNAGGTSASSNVITAITLLTVPVGNTATDIASTSFTANWGTVSGATEYRLDLSVSNTFASFVTGYNDLQITTNTKDITGLTAGTTYYYQVRVKNASVTSANSNTITTITLTSTQGYNANYFVPQYNGNISAIRWRSTGGTGDQVSSIKEYDFRYDGINRLNRAQYQNLSDTSFNSSYNEDNITYDLNGNINTLRRRGVTNTNMQKAIDNLTYTYNGNQLSEVADAGDKQFGFIDPDSPGSDYLYDENGNMKTDNNKGITIKYNLLNLPCRISKGGDSIVYNYDAAGTKLSKKVYMGGFLTTTIDYCGETEFYNNALKYLHTEEGVVEYQITSSFTYEYFLKDHLGNTRAVVSADSSGNLVIGQVDSYYAFGMAHTGIPAISNPGSDNKYRYNGKEMQGESLGGVALDWYDYGARFYDPQIGRFLTQDRYAEKYWDLTPYQYGANNPILFIDVNGDSIDVSRMSGKELKVYQARISEFKEKSKLFNAMYSSLEGSKNIYAVKYGETSKREDGSMVDGQFVPNEDGGGTVTYLNSDINAQALTEELFHAYQNDNKDKYDKGDFNVEFEAKLSSTAIGMEAGTGSFSIAGMENFQNKVGLGDYGKGNMQITPTNVNSASFLNSYKSAANAYAGYNKINNIGNRHYKVSTTVAPYSLKTMVNKAYGK